jgi:hypothetical protein
MLMREDRTNRRVTMQREFGLKVTPSCPLAVRRAEDGPLAKPCGVAYAPVTYPGERRKDFGLVRQENPGAPEPSPLLAAAGTSPQTDQSQDIPRLQMSTQFGLAEVSKEPAVAFHRNLMFEDLQRLPQGSLQAGDDECAKLLLERLDDVDARLWSARKVHCVCTPGLLEYSFSQLPTRLQGR